MNERPDNTTKTAGAHEEREKARSRRMRDASEAGFGE